MALVGAGVNRNAVNTESNAIAGVRNNIRVVTRARVSDQRNFVEITYGLAGSLPVGYLEQTWSYRFTQTLIQTIIN